MRWLGATPRLAQAGECTVAVPHSSVTGGRGLRTAAGGGRRRGTPGRTRACTGCARPPQNPLGKTSCRQAAWARARARRREQRRVTSVSATPLSSHAPRRRPRRTARRATAATPDSARPACHTTPIQILRALAAPGTPCMAGDGARRAIMPGRAHVRRASTLGPPYSSSIPCSLCCRRPMHALFSILPCAH